MASRKAILNQFQVLRDILSSHPDGLSLDGLMRERPIHRLLPRTLLRRLVAMEEAGLLISTGARRNKRYVARAADPDPAYPFRLTEPAQEVLLAIRKPLTMRAPVGYRQDVLEGYEPNYGGYLPPDLQSRLAALGRMETTPTGATYTRTLLERLLIDLSWNSSRLEGNTYSLLETRQLIAHGVHAEGKSAFEAQMILNHREAIEFLVELGPELTFNRYVITNLHAILANQLLPDQRAAGRLRTIEVGIGGSVYTPLAVPDRIAKNFDTLLAKAAAINDPFEASVFAMIQLSYLQPFDDVNKRVARLAANIPLLKHGLCPLSFIDVPPRVYLDGMLGFYELNRITLFREVYAWAYGRSAAHYAVVRQSLGEPDPFRLTYREQLKNAVTQVVTATRGQPQAIRTINGLAERVPPADRARFVEVVQAELLALHGGNIARYRLRPSDFDAWSKEWEVDHLPST